MPLFGSVLTLGSAYALGVLLFRSLPLPHVARFGLGAIAQSLLVYLLLQAGVANRWCFLGIGCLAIAAAFRFRSAPPREAGTVPLDSVSRWIFGTALAAYTALYGIVATSPEIQPDAITYHLGLVAEYVRLARFPARIGFYEVLPQGIEMLFVEAFAFGRHAAAKLVHFAFLMGTVPLMLAAGRRLGLTDRASLAAGILYLCMPVAGITGTSAYNDAALVFFALLAFYLLLLWNEDRRPAYLLAAGFAGGFCYAVKITGLPVAAAVVATAALVTRRVGPAFTAAAGAALCIGPWMGRTLWLTGNPVAPLLNRWFPNPFFNTTIDGVLGAMVSTYGSFKWTAAPMEYAFRGGLQGVMGPLIFMLPFSLLALRKRSGRLLFLGAAVAALPWCWNASARFLMPAMPFLALALALSVPRAGLYACVAMQAVCCWPFVMDRWESPYRWSIHDIPWRAALQSESEDAYLRRTVVQYPVARMLEEKTEPGARVFCLMAAAKAYTTRDTMEYWHSTPSLQLADALQTAYMKVAMAAARAEWPADAMRAVRVVSSGAARAEWRVFEFRIQAPAGELAPDPLWSLNASPNRWDAPWAFDGKRSTAWRSRDSAKPGMFVEADFGREQVITGAYVLLPGELTLPLFIEGLTREGKWKRLAEAAHAQALPVADLRHEAMGALRRAGFRYVLVEVWDRGMGLIGTDMMDHPGEWGVKDAAGIEAAHLFRIL